MCAEFPNSRVGWPGGARWDGPPLRLTSMSGRTSACGLLLLAELLALPTPLPTPQRHLDSPAAPGLPGVCSATNGAAGKHREAFGLQCLVL